ncbi:hypothetical protein [Leptolyngbya sp. GB1-A1]
MRLWNLGSISSVASQFPVGVIVPKSDIEKVVSIDARIRYTSA